MIFRKYKKNTFFDKFCDDIEINSTIDTTLFLKNNVFILKSIVFYISLKLLLINNPICPLKRSFSEWTLRWFLPFCLAQPSL